MNSAGPTYKGLVRKIETQSTATIQAITPGEGTLRGLEAPFKKCIQAPKSVQGSMPKAGKGG